MGERAQHPRPGPGRRTKAYPGGIVEVTDAGESLVGPFDGPPPPPSLGMAIQISRAEQDHHAELRRRSFDLAVERGHIRR